MKKFSLLFLLVIIVLGCSGDTLSDSWIEIPEGNGVVSETDSYISENFSLPYNMEVIYRWNDNENDASKNLVPPTEDKVIPFLKAVKKIWIDSYVKQAGNKFFKPLVPKQLLLVGSPSYNVDGSLTQGTADAGRKITLFEVNDFSPSMTTLIKRYSKTLFHEFTHILHQKKEFSTQYQLITPAYTSSWYLEATETAARKKGFISRYAMSAPEEDFAEMTALFLINDSESWESIISEGGDEMKELLKQKEQLMTTYMLNTWGIDMYEFRKITIASIQDVINGNLD